MKQLIINAQAILSKEDLYRMINEELKLPEWQGNNLDALWDTLSVWNEPLQIIVEHQYLLLAVLGQYGQNFLELLDDLAEENSNITIQS